MKNPTSPRSRERGNALVEFALAFSVIFPLFYGCFQFGYSFFVYNSLRNAVREGARYASVKTYESSTATPTSAFTSAVKNMVVYGNPAGGATPVISGLATSNVAVTVTFVNNVPSRVTVQVQNFSVNAAFKQYHFNKPSSVFPYTGRFAPDGV